MEEEKLVELQNILDAGTPYGEILGIWTDGRNTTHVLTEDINLKAFGYVSDKVGALFDMNSETLGGLNIPLKFKDKFLEQGEKHYHVEKSVT